MADLIHAPWAAEQVETLNRFQRLGCFHPFTCRNRERDTHPMQPDAGDFGVLVATPDGWRCPDCPYTQTWAHAFMADAGEINRIDAKLAEIRARRGLR